VTNFITGIVGIVLVVGFMGFMVAWVPAPPLIIIFIGVMALLIYDFVQSIRSSNNGS